VTSADEFTRSGRGNGFDVLAAHRGGYGEAADLLLSAGADVNRKIEVYTAFNDCGI